MKTFEQIISIFVFTIFLSCSKSFKQNITFKSPENSVTEKIDSIVIHKMNQYNIPGLSLGFIQNDSITYTKGYGIISVKSNKKVTENTVFHAASISKLFTASAIMQLVEKKKLSLDDNLLKVVPELNYSDKRVESISIKHLLNHTSGIPDIYNYNWENNNQSDKSLEEYVLSLNLKLDFAPSSDFSYSNLAYDILGHVIAKISNSTFEDYVKENILDPSRMVNSDFRYFRIPDSLRTIPHSKSKISQRIYSRKTYPYTREHAPSSTLNASAKDLSKWMISFLASLENDKNEGILKAMVQPSSDINKHIGLGFQLSKIEGLKKIGHYGGDKGFRSYLMMIPDEKMGLVLLANCDYEEDFRQEILHAITEILVVK
jgi:CubicO group peptidase (beta-lactamase class C family)